MKWIDIKKQKPLAYESGNWDGLRSREILVCTKGRVSHIARMYHVIMDGSESFDFYDDIDCEITNVAYWAELDYPF